MINIIFSSRLNKYIASEINEVAIFFLYVLFPDILLVEYKYYIITFCTKIRYGFFRVISEFEF